MRIQMLMIGIVVLALLIGAAASGDSK